MKVCTIFLAVLMLFRTIVGQDQPNSWRKFVALESSRDDVEKILGKSDKYFETYGTYENATGKFSVWYSNGGCQTSADGLQWDVPAGKMTGLVVYLNRALPLDSYISNIKVFDRRKSPGGFSRYLYTAPDESVVYETIRRDDSSEFVNSITLQPNKKKQNLLCKKTR